jgi:hypothetical protein
MRCDGQWGFARINRLKSGEIVKLLEFALG